MSNQTNTRRGGFYWDEEQNPMLSVTTILGIIDKPALRYWYGQEVFNAMIKNPGLNEREALAAPYQSGQSAASRGKTVHSIVEAYKQTGAVLTGISEEFQGYASAFYKFMDETAIEIIDQEKTVFDRENRTAGTLDMYAKIGKAFYVLDVKTGKDIYAESGLQLSAYAHMLRAEGKQVDSIGVLLLQIGDDKLPTGNYKFAVATESYEAFLHAKGLYEYLNREKLIKAGYLK